MQGRISLPNLVKISLKFKEKIWGQTSAKFICLEGKTMKKVSRKISLVAIRPAEKVSLPIFVG